MNVFCGSLTMIIFLRFSFKLSTVLIGQIHYFINMIKKMRTWFYFIWPGDNHILQLNGYLFAIKLESLQHFKFFSYCSMASQLIIREKRKYPLIYGNKFAQIDSRICRRRKKRCVFFILRILYCSLFLLSSHTEKMPKFATLRLLRLSFCSLLLFIANQVFFILLSISSVHGYESRPFFPQQNEKKKSCKFPFFLVILKYFQSNN